MSVRERFDLDIQAVQDQLVALCTMSIAALERSFQALLDQDLDVALEIIEDDNDINHLEEEINDRVILLIAKQQPVATDLRRLMVIIKAASDMERVGDYAVNIAKETIRIGREPIIFPMTNFKSMCQKAIEMLQGIVKAFVEENTILAKEVADLDDYVDDLYGATVELLIRAGAEHPDKTKQISHLSFICRYLERSADHATNIAEHLFYLVKGRHYELNT
ncbi:phosphate signaling complex protein PhoU [Metalysinibacillus jejuensis]|uniref:phosphate signaling complex protein PhoU n=1 Tax=Metalysinibacillus jejuensis TaxID=914327 RepID=UPI000D35B5D7|nr:phosphate signaling complex protein PhoU [Metalysinibacillus jejuensis]